MSEANKKVVLQFMEAMGTNNAELAEPCLAPDAVAIAKGFGKFAGARPAETMLSMIEQFKQMMPTGLRFTILNVIAEGDRVAVEAEGNAVTGQGKPYCNQYCFVFTLENGKINLVNEYFCNVLANEVLWPMVEEGQKEAAESASERAS